MTMINQDSDASARGALLDIDDAPQCGHAGPHGSACVIRNATHGTHMDADGREWARPRAPLAAAVTMAAALAVSSPETPAPAAPAAQAAPLGPQAVPYAEGWRAMMARFPSRCGHCSAQILRGDSIGWHAAAREARHDRCVPRAAVAPAAPVAAPVAAPDPAGYVTAWPDPAVVLSRLTGQPAASAPAAAPVAAPVVRWHLSRAGEAGGGYWVKRAGGSVAAEGRVMGLNLDTNAPSWHVAGRYEAGVPGRDQLYPSALAAAAALTGDPVACHAMAPEGAAAPSITGRARPTMTPQQRAQRVIGAGVTAAVVETPAQRKAREDAAARRRAAAQLDAAIRVGLGGGDGKYPHGCLVAWLPAGERPWHVVAAAAERAGVAPPAQKTDKAIASSAVASLKRAGYDVKPGETRGSTWTVYRPASHVAVGDSVGAASLVAALDGENLSLAGPADLCASVRTVWNKAREVATLGSVEVTSWISGMLRQWRSVRVAYGWWVAPGARSEAWVRLAVELNAAGLRVPSRPAEVMSRADVAEEITEGLKGEVAALLADIGRKRDAARETRGDLGVRGASNALTEVADLKSKIDLYECIVGPMGEQRAALDAIAADLAPLVSDAAARTAMLDLD